MPTPHRFWRIAVNSNNGGTQVNLGDLELRSGTNVTLNVAGSGYGISSTDDGVHFASAINDGSAVTYWQSLNGATISNQWIGWAFSFPQSILNFGLRNSNLGSTLGYILSFAIQYSDDGIAWTAASGALTNNVVTPSILTNFSLGGNADAALSVGFSFASYGGATLKAAMPSPLMAGYGGASANLLIPSISFSAMGGANGSMQAGQFLLQATGHDATGENSADIALPGFSVRAFGGANASLSMATPVLEISGAFWGNGRASLFSPSGIVFASGFAGSVGGFAATMPSPKVVGYSGGLIAVSISGFSVAASGVAGASGRAVLTLPPFVLSASGYGTGVAHAALTMPALVPTGSARALLSLPGFTLVAVGSSVVAISYEAYATNLLHGEEPAQVTRYTNFPFTHIVRYQGDYFGVSPNGLFLLGGVTDYATPKPTPIRWDFETHVTDLDSPLKKTIVAAYFGGRLGKSETIRLVAGEKPAKTYPYTTPRGETAQNHRQKFGRGIKERYFAVGATGTGELELDNIEFDTATMTRRI
jgi:hypothetical protein